MLYFLIILIVRKLVKLIINEELKVYLQEQFQEDMTWDNYGEWHIDHKIALISFNLEDREEFLKACNYSNLQPLWAIDNLKKGSR